MLNHVSISQKTEEIWREVTEGTLGCLHLTWLGHDNLAKSTIADIPQGLRLWGNLAVISIKKGLSGEGLGSIDARPAPHRRDRHLSTSFASLAKFGLLPGAWAPCGQNRALFRLRRRLE